MYGVCMYMLRICIGTAKTRTGLCFPSNFGDETRSLEGKRVSVERVGVTLNASVA